MQHLQAEFEEVGGSLFLFLSRLYNAHPTRIGTNKKSKGKEGPFFGGVDHPGCAAPLPCLRRERKKKKKTISREKERKYT